jgi:hypothetical protein
MPRVWHTGNRKILLELRGAARRRDVRVLHGCAHAWCEVLSPLWNAGRR